MNCPRYVNPDGILENFLSPTVMTSARCSRVGPPSWAPAAPGGPIREKRNVASGAPPAASAAFAATSFLPSTAPDRASPKTPSPTT